MTLEQQTLLLLLQRGLFGRKMSLPIFVDWREIFEESRRQAVCSIALDGLGDDCGLLPPELLQTWKRQAYIFCGYFYRLLEHQKRVLEDLNQVPCAVLKGFGAAAYYPKPFYRMMGDIDLLVPAKEFEKAANGLTEKGYLSKPGSNEHHVLFYQDSFLVELHYRVGGLPEGEVGQHLGSLFADSCMDHLCQAELEGMSFPVLPKRQQALSLLLHMGHHLLNGELGLRQACDWAVFIQQEQAEDFWAELIPVLRKSGLMRFAKIMTAFCVQDLGVSGPLPFEQPEESQYAAVRQQLFENGNMGRGSKNRYGARLLARASKTIGGVLCHLQIQGVRRWAACRKFPPLKLFAWMYFPVCFIGQICAGKRSVGSIGAMFQKAKKMNGLSALLCLFEPEA